GEPYLDGGCSEKIPWSWAERNSPGKKIVVLTREKSFRRKPGASPLTRVVYRRYPQFADALYHANQRFNDMMDDLTERERRGEIFIIAPSKPVTVTRFEGDIDKLSTLYWLGYYDTYNSIAALRRYLRG
ncbi:MAG: patatin family protein, partial [Oscillospiraceae bacterium]|nr:patatin family protein [Oscillospiraceae bacterium]